MNKLLFSLLGASVALNFYLVKVDVVVKDDLDDEYHEPAPIDQISVAQAGVQKEDSICPPCVQKACNDQSKTQDEEFYTQVRDSYKQESGTFFEYVLRLSTDQIFEYRKLKEQRSQEITGYLNERHDNKETIMLSSEEMLQLGKIDEKYNTQLKKIWGVSAFEEYQVFLEDFNERLLGKGLEKYSIQF